MTRYYVVSPVYTYREHVDAYYGGPEVETVDCFEIEADTPSDAKVLAVAAMRNDWDYRDGWVQSRIGDGLCPFGGLRVEVADESDEVHW